MNSDNARNATRHLWRYGKSKKTEIAYGLIALAVMLPLLGRGYILSLDMVFVPTLRVPDTVSSSYLFHALLAGLGHIMPSDIIQKIMLFSILILSGIGAHRLLKDLADKKPTTDTTAAYVAGMLYMINPYTYSRFMAGQYSVLLGYAFLPFFARTLLQFLGAPGARTMFPVMLWAVLISIVSVHSIGLVAVLSITGLGLAVWQHRQHRSQLQTLCAYSLGGLLIAAALSSYWLVPLLLGSSETAQTIARFGTGDQQAFATLGGSVIGKLANVVRLQGFWAEAHGQYALPQDRMPAWGLVALAVWALVFAGGRRLWQQGRHAETALFGSAALAAVLVSVSGLSAWLMHLPLLAGYREPHKFVGLVALTFALFTGLGAAAILARLTRRYGETTASAGAGILLALPLAFTPTMFWGFNGQLKPQSYPSDWSAMNQRLNHDSSNFQVLFLPWHLYMPFEFTGRQIANPARKFFDKPILVSDNPEFDDVSASSDPVIRKLDKVLADATKRQDLGKQMSAHNIKYILLAKDSDYEKYQYLDNQQDLHLLQETTTLKLYRNQAWRHEE